MCGPGVAYVSEIDDLQMQWPAGWKVIRAKDNEGITLAGPNGDIAAVHRFVFDTKLSSNEKAKRLAQLREFVSLSSIDLQSGELNIALSTSAQQVPNRPAQLIRSLGENRGQSEAQFSAYSYYLGESAIGVISIKGKSNFESMTKSGPSFSTTSGIVLK
jgi:hypothetical protein